MAERSNAAVLKTVEGYTSGGSNPSLSALIQVYKNPAEHKVCRIFALKDLKTSILNLKSMKQSDFLNIIPEQYTGNELVTEVSHSLKNKEEANIFYKIARERLLDVNNWHSIAGFISGKFQLTNDQGENLGRYVNKGDYFKIDIPGPGSTEGEGYDWVFVEELKERDTEIMQSTGFRVRPSSNPLNDKVETAHFYSDEGTSTFIIIRTNNIVMVQIIDSNLKPNEDIGSVTDRLRNMAVGVGALGLFSKIQWKNLADGIIKN